MAKQARKPKNEVKPGRFRVQFDFSATRIEQLDKITTEAKSSSRAHTVKRALDTYDYLLKQVTHGHDLTIDNSTLRMILGLPQGREAS
ncbi:MAG: hypothetical protein ACOYBJ_01965 [Patescibacteria group bacterium]